LPGRGNPRIAVRFDPLVLEWMKSEANRRGITISGLIRAVVEGYARKKEGVRHPIFLSEKALERVFHVRFLQAVSRLRFIIAGSRLDIPALREEKLLEVCDILDQLNALAARTRDAEKRLLIHDRIARFYRIFDMMAKNAEYDEIKRMLDELEAEEAVRVGEPQETNGKAEAEQS